MITTILASPTTSYESRILPFAEYPRLNGTELGPVWPLLRPDDAFVTVVEQGDQIVACWALMRVWHLEGAWIHPAHRKKTAVARRLWVGMRRLAARLGVRSAMTAAVSDDVRAILKTAGATKLPGDHFLLPLEGR